MKKITFIFTLLTAVFGYSQTYSLYTDDATISTGVPTFFNNVEGFSEGWGTPYEGASSRIFVFNGTSSWFMGQILHSNGTYGALDLSSYNYYNVALKTSSTTSFYLRMKGNGITAKILFSSGSDPYGFARDDEWHFLSIPLADFVAEDPAFSLTSVSELLVLRSDGTLDATNNDFEMDHFYMSTESALSISNIEKNETVAVYPNPANSVINIKSQSAIASVVIYNVTGQKVLETSISENLNVSSLKTGVYFIKTFTENGESTTSKFMKN